MIAYEAKDRLLAKIEAAAKAKVCCPVGSFGYLMSVLESVQAQSRSACYVAECAIIEAEKPGRFGQHDVYPGDYLGFFKNAEQVEIETPADWEAWLVANNMD